MSRMGINISRVKTVYQAELREQTEEPYGILSTYLFYWHYSPYLGLEGVFLIIYMSVLSAIGKYKLWSPVSEVVLKKSHSVPQELIRKLCAFGPSGCGKIVSATNISQSISQFLFRTS